MTINYQDNNLIVMFLQIYLKENFNSSVVKVVPKRKSQPAYYKVTSSAPIKVTGYYTPQTYSALALWMAYNYPNEGFPMRWIETSQGSWISEDYIYRGNIEELLDIISSNMENSSRHMGTIVVPERVISYIFNEVVTPNSTPEEILRIKDMMYSVIYADDQHPRVLKYNDEFYHDVEKVQQEFLNKWTTEFEDYKFILDCDGESTNYVIRRGIDQINTSVVDYNIDELGSDQSRSSELIKRVKLEDKPIKIDTVKVEIPQENIVNENSYESLGGLTSEGEVLPSTQDKKTTKYISVGEYEKVDVIGYSEGSHINNLYDTKDGFSKHNAETKMRLVCEDNEYQLRVPGTYSGEDFIIETQEYIENSEDAEVERVFSVVSDKIHETDGKVPAKLSLYEKISTPDYVEVYDLTSSMTDWEYNIQKSTLIRSYDSDNNTVNLKFNLSSNDGERLWKKIPVIPNTEYLVSFTMDMFPKVTNTWSSTSIGTIVPISGSVDLVEKGVNSHSSEWKNFDTLWKSVSVIPNISSSSRSKPHKSKEESVVYTYTFNSENNSSVYMLMDMQAFTDVGPADINISDFKIMTKSSLAPVLHNGTSKYELDLFRGISSERSQFKVFLKSGSKYVLMLSPSDPELLKSEEVINFKLQISDTSYKKVHWFDPRKQDVAVVQYLRDQYGSYSLSTTYTGILGEDDRLSIVAFTLKNQKSTYLKLQQVVLPSLDTEIKEGKIYYENTSEVYEGVYKEKTPESSPYSEGLYEIYTPTVKPYHYEYYEQGSGEKTYRYSSNDGVLIVEYNEDDYNSKLSTLVRYPINPHYHIASGDLYIDSVFETGKSILIEGKLNKVVSLPDQFKDFKVTGYVDPWTEVVIKRGDERDDV